MGKMIAVCGAPGSGKTTAALKIAEEIYYAKKGSVIFLSPDLNVPCLAFVFPNCKEEELYSVGVALDRTDIYREDVLRQMNHVKTMENFGFLGYKAGENKYSYPRPTEDKILNLFSILRELADYVIVDCADGLISSMAKSHAYMLVQLITPDLKCMAYYSSNSGMFGLGAENRIKVMNIWAMKPEYEELVTEALENSFGEVENKSTFTDVLLKIADLAVTDSPVCSYRRR